MKHILLHLVLLCTAFTGGLQAQGIAREDTHVPSRFFSAAADLHVNGFALHFKWGKGDVSNLRYYAIDFGKMRHQKEFRYTSNPPYNGFVFGRTHIAMPLNFGVGKMKTLGIRNGKNDVGLSYSFQAGISLALLKPVYLYIDRKPGTLQSNVELVKYENESTIEYNNIIGGASFFTGMNQMTLMPGVFTRASLLFNWGRYTGDFHAVETGVMITAYSKSLPLMATIKNNPVYPTVFIAFNLGKYW